MSLKYSQSTYNTFLYGPAEPGFQFKIQISDSAGTPVLFINNEVKELNWGYKRVGGCQKFSLVLKREFDNLLNLTSPDREEIYDLQIYITSVLNGASTLFYRGYITDIRPNLRDGEETIVSGIGYGQRLEEIQVHDGTGAPKVYTNKTITQLVNALFTDFVDGNCEVVAGTVDTFSTLIQSIKFNGTVQEALEKLASFVDAEWGVDRNLELYFLQKSGSVGHRFMIGRDVGDLQDEFDYSEIINKVYIEGGDINGVPFRMIKAKQASINLFGLKERRINNSSVVDSAVANILADSVLEKYSTFQRNTRITLPFNKVLIEDILPLPMTALIPAPKPLTRKYATFKYGAGAGNFYCGETEYKINAIQYELRDVSLNTVVEFNEGKPDFTSEFALLEFQLEQQRQAEGV